MKKLLISSILALSLCAPAYASSIDVTTLSDSELMELHEDIHDEFANREIKDSIIHEGTYIVGKDIRAGHFSLTCVETSWSFGAILFETEEEYDLYFTEQENGTKRTEAIEAHALSSTYVYKSDVIDLNLEEGMVLMLRQGSAFIEETSPSWAP